MKTKETVSYIKSIAKKAGLTFKCVGSGCITATPYYAFFERGTSHMVYENVTLSVALDDACSGYIESWDGKRFRGV